MPERSAGLLLYRRTPDLEVFLGHMGGPFWARKDTAAWSIPKGLYLDDEQPLAAALREFAEEIGVPAPMGEHGELGAFRLPSGKLLTVFTLESPEMTFVASNTFETEWPPRSGRMQSFPEIDRAEWLGLDEARVKLVKGQLPVLDALVTSLGRRD